VGCVSYSRGGTATGRLEAGQLCSSTWCVCVCVSAGTPAQLHIACCRICSYASFQLSHCQPRCCCCRFAGVTPANSIGLSKWPDSTVGFVYEHVGGTINALPSQRHAAAMVDCHYLPTVILIITGIPSPTDSFTLGLNPSFSANPLYRSLSFFSFRIHYMDFPDCLLLLQSISVFLLFSFFFFLHSFSCRFPCGRLI